jgi:uncharacterized protein YdbL (DUF1318 family)
MVAMNRKIMIAVGIAVAATGVFLAQAAVAAASQDAASGHEPALLRATGLVGEKWDGYMEVVGSAPSSIRKRVDAVNIERKALYAKRAAGKSTIEAMAAVTACEIFANKIKPGEYYQLPDGAGWRKREGAAPVQLPKHCPGQ